MLSPAAHPVYDPTPPSTSTALSTLISQLSLRPSTFSSLSLNCIPISELRSILLSVHGLGPLSVNKIAVARDLHGDFLSASDFDRRVRGLTFARVSKLCRAEGWIVKLTGSGRMVSSGVQRWEGGDRDEDQGKLMGLVTWNAGRMSRTGKFWDQKMACLERLVRECDPDVLLMQEMCRGAGKEAARRMNEGEDRWRLFEGGAGDVSLVILHKKYIRLSEVDSDGLEETLEGFIRKPQIALVEVKRERLIVVNVHLWQREPRGEIGRVGKLVKELRKLDDGSVVIGGDFNMNADGGVFEAVRGGGMIELVRPEGHVGGYCAVRENTTVGGGWLDNFWVEETRRKDVVEGFCFEFGGKGRGLRQSGWEFAAEKRSRCSDHRPVVMKMRIGGVVGSPLGS